MPISEALVRSAASLAKERLQGLRGSRWAHVQAVTARARDLAEGLSDQSLVIAAAWLHDVGYAPGLSTTGFHPLDGARFLRAEGWPAELCDLVAHHTRADVEADLRGLGDLLRAEFEDRAGPGRDALWAADATIGPAGERFTVRERVAEVQARYGSDHLVAQCMRIIEPELQAAVDRAEARLAQLVT